jgi:hypothetical protein
MKLPRKHLQKLGVGILLSGLAFSASAGLASAQWYNGPPPPPPPRHENHMMRPGHAWDNGHWRRAGDRWVWVPGRYVAMVPAHHWIAGHWRMGPQGRFWVDGHWG